MLGNTLALGPSGVIGRERGRPSHGPPELFAPTDVHQATSVLGELVQEALEVPMPQVQEAPSTQAQDGSDAILL
jgi:hypothetical protein